MNELYFLKDDILHNLNSMEFSLRRSASNLQKSLKEKVQSLNNQMKQIYSDNIALIQNAIKNNSMDNLDIEKMFFDVSVDYSELYNCISNLQLNFQKYTIDIPIIIQNEINVGSILVGTVSSQSSKFGEVWIEHEKDENSINVIQYISHNIRMDVLKGKICQNEEEKWNKGDLVFALAMTPSGTLWLRGVVECINEKSIYKVVFLDFGNSEFVPSSRILSAPIGLFSEFPYQAICIQIKLNNIATNGLPVLLKLEINDLIFGKNVKCEVVSKAINDQSFDVWQVNLYSEENHINKLIDDKIVNENKDTVGCRDVRYKDRPEEVLRVIMTNEPIVKIENEITSDIKVIDEHNINFKTEINSDPKVTEELLLTNDHEDTKVSKFIDDADPEFYIDHGLSSLPKVITLVNVEHNGCNQHLITKDIGSSNNLILNSEHSDKLESQSNSQISLSNKQNCSDNFFNLGPKNYDINEMKKRERNSVLKSIKDFMAGNSNTLQPPNNVQQVVNIENNKYQECGIQNKNLSIHFPNNQMKNKEFIHQQKNLTNTPRFIESSNFTLPASSNTILLASSASFKPSETHSVIDSNIQMLEENERIYAQTRSFEIPAYYVNSIPNSVENLIIKSSPNSFVQNSMKIIESNLNSVQNLNVYNDLENLSLNLTPNTMNLNTYSCYNNCILQNHQHPNLNLNEIKNEPNINNSNINLNIKENINLDLSDNQNINGLCYYGCPENMIDCSINDLSKCNYLYNYMNNVDVISSNISNLCEADMGNSNVKDSYTMPYTNNFQIPNSLLQNNYINLLNLNKVNTEENCQNNYNKSNGNSIIPNYNFMELCHQNQSVQDNYFQNVSSNNGLYSVPFVKSIVEMPSHIPDYPNTNFINEKYLLNTENKPKEDNISKVSNEGVLLFDDLRLKRDIDLSRSDSECSINHLPQSGLVFFNSNCNLPINEPAKYCDISPLQMSFCNSDQDLPKQYCTENKLDDQTVVVDKIKESPKKKLTPRKEDMKIYTLPSYRNKNI